MINSYRSAVSQLNTLNQYMQKNTENLLINAELYTALMDIRDRLQKEIGSFELHQSKMNSKYAKVLKKREEELNDIKRKRGEDIIEDLGLDNDYTIWFD